ncbi:hypothetical protein FANTH_7295 [Fusarium anthophilum]|uniref:BTB domain-containing protein n=1 Tax=Fusarium anthophilum TaxID=48485 RepID=A0A8H4ZFU6_9HYPO|nr:hypothetical protein FANTH_7295 [Fusarium anthophilum]
MGRSSNKGMSSDSETKVPDEAVIPNGDRILIVRKGQLRIQNNRAHKLLTRSPSSVLVIAFFSFPSQLHRTRTMSREQIPDETVVAGGDIILVVGNENRRIQVSSEFLIQASPVFDAMLNLKFLEGNKLHEGNEFPVEIKLPEDDGLATAQALKTLHGSDPEMLLLAPDQIQKVSIIVDKYDMSPCFAMASTVWMDCELINLEDAWKLMTAAYWLDHLVGFRRMSEYVIRKLNHAQIFRLANETFDATLGLKLGSEFSS